MRTLRLPPAIRHRHAPARPDCLRSKKRHLPRPATDPRTAHAERPPAAREGVAPNPDPWPVVTIMRSRNHQRQRQPRGPKFPPSRQYPPPPHSPPRSDSAEQPLPRNKIDNPVSIRIAEHPADRKWIEPRDPPPRATLKRPIGRHTSTARMSKPCARPQACRARHSCRCPHLLQKSPLGIEPEINSPISCSIWHRESESMYSMCPADKKSQVILFGIPDSGPMWLNVYPPHSKGVAKIVVSGRNHDLHVRILHHRVRSRLWCRRTVALPYPTAECLRWCSNTCRFCNSSSSRMYCWKIARTAE